MLAMQRCPFCPYTTKSAFTLTRHRSKCRFAKCAETASARSGKRLSALTTVLPPLSNPNPYDNEIGLQPPSLEDFCYQESAIPETSCALPPPTDVLIDELASFLDVLARKTGTRMANQLLKFFHKTEFELTSFRKKIISISDCRTMVAKNCGRMFSNNGF